MKISKTQAKILLALANGATLKSHRYLDGAKVYQLHPLDGPAETVRRTTVDALRERGLIHSNQKFPAATYLLTDTGQQIAAQLAKTKASPVSARNYFQDKPASNLASRPTPNQIEFQKSSRNGKLP